MHHPEAISYRHYSTEFRAAESTSGFQCKNPNSSVSPMVFKKCNRDSGMSIFATDTFNTWRIFSRGA